MRPLGLILMTLIATPALSPLSAQTSPQAALLVLSKRAHTLSIVDPATLRVTAAVPVGDDPHEVIVSTDGSTAYASNYGFGAFNTITPVDLIHHTQLPPIDLGPLRGPHGLAFVGGKLWFTSEVAKAIGRYDPATHKVDMILGNGQNRIHMLYVSPDQQRIVATNVNSATVSLFELQPVAMPGPPPGVPGAGSPPPGPPPGSPRTEWNQTVIPVGKGSEGFDVSPDGKTIWVANARDATLSVIDIASKQVTQTLHVNTPGANRLKFTPDGSRVLVSAGPEVVILDAHTYAVIKRIPVGKNSAGLLIQPDGTRAYVSCGPDNYVAVIDLATLTIVGHITAGDEPDGLAWAVRP